MQFIPAPRPTPKFLADHTPKKATSEEVFTNNQCKRCRKTFSRSSSQQRHIAINRCRAHNYWCRFCHKHFHVMSQLKRHEKIHLDEISQFQTGGAFPQIAAAHGCKIFRRSFAGDEVPTIEGAIALL